MLKNWLLVSDYIFNLNYLNFYKNFLIEDLIVVFLLYNFFKYLIICTITELIWPTQMFNRKHLMGFQVVKFRTYTETILKLRNYNSYFYVFNYFVLKYQFIYKK